ncbi:hypothetical protein RM549_14915 [Salegentibacter sp. F188]|uniref:Uncharacterized protein n=1 Tax=Autumnicola patrickiae TaxID=3075591 RepID=A0ABU3E516_9FLAO|nr:hypothetical protein [Salegentibacter sp. F188]MDT0691083.1 hypothetical protein [Salegentibacter sp. F188]
MRFNNNISSHTIGHWKLPYSLSGPQHKRKKWVNENDTEKIEHFTGGLFITYLREVEKRNVLYYSQNLNDDHKNPDLLIHMDERIHTVQVTQIVLNNYLTKFNQTKRLCEKISNFIRDVYTPPIKINIQIYPPWEIEEPPKAPIKVYRRLSKTIAKSISENIENLSAKNEILNFKTDDIFNKIADGYNLLSVPKNRVSHYFGDKNVYVDYEFDAIKISVENIESATNKIFTDKNNGNSEILLIWGDQNQFMGTEQLIIKNLKDQFVKSTFKSIYFLAFQNTLEVEKREILCVKVI